MFKQIDTNGDMLLSYDEFFACIPKLLNWGVDVKDPIITFLSMQSEQDISKEVTFLEFLNFASINNLKINEGDDDDQSSDSIE